jgi:hypothetical protein
VVARPRSLDSRDPRCAACRPVVQMREPHASSRRVTRHRRHSHLSPSPLRAVCPN